LTDHDSEAQLAAGSAAPGPALNAGGSQVAAAIVAEIRARRDDLADDERWARMFPHSRQTMTQRQRQMEAAFINGLLLALTHALSRPYDISAAERLIGKGAGQ
jgi:hypothetical protein